MAEQLAVITKRALTIQTIGKVFRTNEIVADCDSGWRVQVGDEDEKCFDRAEYLDLIPLEQVCHMAPDFARILEQPEEAAYTLVDGCFQVIEA